MEEFPDGSRTTAEMAADRKQEPAAPTWCVEPGEPLPLGACQRKNGTNFAVFSRHATAMQLLIFDPPNAPDPALRLELDARHHRTGDIWHAHLAGLGPGIAYAFEVDKPDGLHLGPPARLLDPYASAVIRIGTTNAPGCYRALAVDQTFDWEGDEPPAHPWTDTVLYETHVRGLTFHPSSDVRHRGQYIGLLEKIPYFRELGVTALELMPVQAFDPVPAMRPADDPRRQYWGYNPIGLFAPTPFYGGGNIGAELIEFKTMVRELHRAGIEVILDVVFNHTSEGGADEPALSWRGFANEIYYMIDQDGHYLDYTGCGNTVNCNHPIVRRMIIDCLRHWVMHMHVDGFRFDLAAVLGRDRHGNLMPNPPLLEEIAEDPLLRNVKLIAEAWDVAGVAEAQMFSGPPWAEWNNHYRDDIRRFWRGDPRMTGRFATRISGSPDLFGNDGAPSPIKSINYVTCHDGFTLNDLVSYSIKHNEANGHGNQDGPNENISENNGIEGRSSDPGIECIRTQQIKNILLSLFMSKGVPMLLGGDEFRRSQGGNNNNYCHDNETSWYNWQLAAQYPHLVRFVQKLIAFRKKCQLICSASFYEDHQVVWFGADGKAPQWEGVTNRLGCLIRQDPAPICLLFNAGPDSCRFSLPDEGYRWRTVFDTRPDAPDDAPDPTSLLSLFQGRFIVLDARSSVVLRAA